MISQLEMFFLTSGAFASMQIDEEEANQGAFFI